MLQSMLRQQFVEIVILTNPKAKFIESMNPFRIHQQKKATKYRRIRITLY